MKLFPRLFTFAIYLLVAKVVELCALYIFFLLQKKYQINISCLNDVTALPYELRE